MELRLDLDRCTGHGRCYSIAPQVFEPDDEGYARLLVDGEVPAADEELARRAAVNCPERAIEVVESPQP